MSMDFIPLEEVQKVVRHDISSSATFRVLDSSEVGNGEGADVMVVVVEVSHPGMKSPEIEAYTDHRFYVFKRGQKFPAYAGIV